MVPCCPFPPWGTANPGCALLAREESSSSVANGRPCPRMSGMINWNSHSPSSLCILMNANQSWLQPENPCNKEQWFTSSVHVKIDRHTVSLSILPDELAGVMPRASFQQKISH